MLLCRFPQAQCVYKEELTSNFDTKQVEVCKAHGYIPKSQFEIFLFLAGPLAGKQSQRIDSGF